MEARKEGRGREEEGRRMKEEERERLVIWRRGEAGGEASESKNVRVNIPAASFRFSPE